ncbi:MAG: transglutaminase-like domain-containing protein [Anaerovoracaceae bacterium]
MQLKLKEQESTTKYKGLFKNAVLALIITIGAVGSFVSIFHLSYSINQAFGGGLIGGAVCLYNGICDALGSSDYIILTKFSGASDSGGLVITIVGIATFAFSMFVLKSKNQWLYLIYVVPLFGVLVFTDLSCNYIFGGILLVGILIGLLDGWNFRDKILPGIKIIIVSMVVILAFVTVLGQDNIRRPKFLEDAGYAIEKSLVKITKGTSPLSNGDLNSVNVRTKSKEPNLEVTMENPESIYLKGFVGSKYIKNSWTSLENGTYYKEYNQMYYINKYGLNGLSQLGTVKELTDEKKKTNKIQVKNLGGSREYIYTPYEITDIETIKDNAKAYDKGNENLLSSKLFGSKKYEYTAKENITGEWTDVAGRFFSQKPNDEIKEYQRVESHYNKLVYENYTELSDKTDAIISGIFNGKKATKDGHIDYKVAIKTIDRYLNDNFIYTDNVSKVKDKEDFFESFIKNKKGYDVHFATAATLMFRYYGIPARYVEGYVITQNDEKKTKANEPIIVMAKNAHSWCEIYVDGFGFVPVEFSQPFKEMMKQPDMTKGLEVISSNTPYENENDFKGKLKKDKGNTKDFSVNWILVLLSIIGFLLLVILALIIKKVVKLLLHKRKIAKAFGNQDYKLACCAIYSEILKYNLSVEEQAQKVGEKAAYSPYQMNQEDKEVLLVELERVKREKKDVSKKKNNSSHNVSSNVTNNRLWGKKFRGKSK